MEGSIAHRQGRFEEAVERLTAALQVDPTSLQLIKQLAFLQLALRHWPEAERLWNRAIELAPNDPQRMDDRARFIFAKTGSLAELKSFLGTLRPGAEDDRNYLSDRICVAILERDWPTARAEALEIGDTDSFDYFGFLDVSVPEKLVLVEIARFAGENLDTDEFRRLRETLAQRVAASSDTPTLLVALAFFDALLGHTEQALAAAEKVAQALPAIKDPITRADLQANLAAVLAWSGQVDRAFQLLDQVTAAPCFTALNYGFFLVDPIWDPLRHDPRYATILAKLKPKD